MSEERFPITRNLQLVADGATIRVELPGFSEPLDLDHAWMAGTVLQVLVRERRSGRLGPLGLRRKRAWKR